MATYREPGTGRYAFWNDFERLCKCGHTLGVHIAGGFECGIDEAIGCKCERFVPSGKRRQSAPPGNVVAEGGE